MGAPERRRERKIVTVLFADLVGFTARAEELDPEDVEAILSRYHAHLRDELERFGGTVEKFIGDAVMAVFGAPQAHEDDPERAVRAALAIRDWAREQGGLEVRVAVNTGEAVVNLDARPDAGEGMVSGDVVNTAARLQSAAPVNGVLVGERAHEATRHVIEYSDAKPVEAKGKAEPVAVWEAVQARSRFGVDVRQETRAPLVGRERERTLLVQTLGRVLAERSPQLVTLVGVVGVPGIGKSRLVYELFRRGDLGDELIAWRQGRSLPYGEGVSFWALGEMVKAHAGILEGDTAPVVAEKLEEVLRPLVAEDELEWVRAHLAALLGLETDTASGGDRRTEAFTAWRRFLEALADQRPLVLVFEDLHWADDGLLDFVDHLADWASSVPLLVLASARPELLERRPGWGGGKLNALTLALSPLAEDDAARLIAGVLGQAVLPADTQQALLIRAGGNPLYAEQFARLYIERGAVDDLPLPGSVQGLIAARLDALPREEKSLLQDAAVMGKVFWPGALGSGGDVRARLHALERKEFVRRERRSSVSGEDEFAFRHVLVRDVAYGQIPRAERVEKHRRAAAWIDALGRPEDHAELLAHHYVAALELARALGEETDDLAERAGKALREAGARTFALNAFGSAVGFYRDALELTREDDPVRLSVLFQLGRARSITEERGDDELREVSAAADPEMAAEAEAILAELAAKRGQRDQAFAHLDRAASLVEERPPSRAKAFVLSNRARYLALAGRYEQALPVGRQALAMAEELGFDDVRAHALNNIGLARFNLGDDVGLEDLRRSIDVANAINSPESIRGYINSSVCHFVAGKMIDAERLREEGTQVARRFGHAGNVLWLEVGRAHTAYSTGNWDDALVFADGFIADVEAGSPHYLEHAVRTTRAFIRFGRDDIAGALDDTAKAERSARDAKDPQALYPSLTVRAAVLLEAGDRAAANVVLDEVMALRAEDEQTLPFAGGAEVIWLWRRLGRLDEALRLVAGPRRTPWFDAAELTAAGDPVAAADLYAEIGVTNGEALTRLRAAEELVASGRRTEADVQLRKALTFYRDVRATRYIRQGEALLAKTA